MVQWKCNYIFIFIFMVESILYLWSTLCVPWQNEPAHYRGKMYRMNRAVSALVGAINVNVYSICIVNEGIIWYYWGGKYIDHVTNVTTVIAHGVTLNEAEHDGHYLLYWGSYLCELLTSTKWLSMRLTHRKLACLFPLAPLFALCHVYEHIHHFPTIHL